MVKVKLFQQTDNVELLTNDINNWLVKAEEKQYEVKSITHRVTGRMDTTTVVMITYL